MENNLEELCRRKSYIEQQIRLTSIRFSDMLYILRSTLYIHIELKILFIFSNVLRKMEIFKYWVKSYIKLKGLCSAKVLSIRHILGNNQEIWSLNSIHKMFHCWAQLSYKPMSPHKIQNIFVFLSKL